MKTFTITERHMLAAGNLPEIPAEIRELVARALERRIDELIRRVLFTGHPQPPASITLPNRPCSRREMLGVVTTTNVT